MESEAEAMPFVFDRWGYQCQLVAIGSLLNRNEEADKELVEKIEGGFEVARQLGRRANDHLDDYYTELVQISCYQDAAHSMAAVGMIAPFIESLFRSTFVSIGAPLSGQGCIVNDVVRRVKEAGMEGYMPADLEPTLVALFEYRNKMFHGGFEWSSEELNKFERRLGQNTWPSDWFDAARSGDQPWMFYMTPDFVDHCFKVAVKVVEGLDRYFDDALGSSL